MAKGKNQLTKLLHKDSKMQNDKDMGEYRRTQGKKGQSKNKGNKTK